MHDHPDKQNPIQQKQHQSSFGEGSSYEYESGVSMPPPAFQLRATSASSSPIQMVGADLVKGFAATTGHDVSNVNIETNSSDPGKVGAHAYAQGNTVKVAPGQEKHIPHEIGHVVQQREGMVKANTSVNGMPVNDDPGLEKHADKLGDAAVNAGKG